MNTLGIRVPEGTIPFGFESTWRLLDARKQSIIDNKKDFSDTYISTTLLTNNQDFIYDYNDLNSFKPITNDPHNIEIQTYCLTDIQILLYDFKRLSKLMRQHGFVESSKSYRNTFEGGGHIHLDYSRLFGDLGNGNDYYSRQFRLAYTRFSKSKIFRECPNLDYSRFNDNKDDVNLLFSLFQYNMQVYILNNPWLPWTFNAPNDNLTACILSNTRWRNIDRQLIRNVGLQQTINLISDAKQWAVTVRPDFGTFEFRFFGMPKDEYDLELHLNLAQAIYKHVLALTLNEVVLKPKFTRKGLLSITYPEAIEGLKRACGDLKIYFKQIEACGKLNNLKIRYAYHADLLQAGEKNPDLQVLN